MQMLKQRVEDIFLYIGAAHVNADADISAISFSLDDSDTVFAAQAFAADGTWMTDLPKAQAKAKELNE